MESLPGLNVRAARWLASKDKSLVVSLIQNSIARVKGMTTELYSSIVFSLN